MEYQIKWKKGDYVKLGKAVAEFNRKIKELQNNENLLYLPEFKEYKELKNNIVTRKELNRIINSLQKFDVKGSELIELESGDHITKWEYKELKKNQQRMIKRLKKEIEPFTIPLESGFSKAQMGSMRYNELLAQLENVKEFEEKSEYELIKMKRRLWKQGASDIEMKRAIVYRENYYNVIKDRYSNFDGYDKLEFLFKSLKNPLKFYDFMVERDNELLIDLTYQSEQYYTQQEFNRFLESLGININSSNKEIIGFLDEMNLL